jgi:hypothetical protein
MAENYKLTDPATGAEAGTVNRIDTGESIPDALDVPQRVRYNEWLAEGNTPQAADPIPEPTWKEKRQANIADGGYGTQWEQLEMIGEQGMDVYQAHIAAVKAAIPKPV